jgi:hypothetical protein
VKTQIHEWRIMNGESEWKERCQNFTMFGIRYFCSSTKI